jgi:M-phase inducer tyrosine phosphatase
MEKANSSAAMLFGAMSGRANTVSSRRGALKRPSPMPMPSGSQISGEDASQRSVSAASAYPILCGPQNTLVAKFPNAGNPMRRAYSVCDQPKMMSTPGGADEDESEFEDSPSVHGEYAKRHGQKYVPRVDGSPGFKPARSSYAAPAASPSGKGKKASPLGAGLPGFGDNEMTGKILPCHKVKEDGLVRITSETVR